jgi:hypothetical protein
MAGLVDVSNKVDSMLDELFVSFEKPKVQAVFEKHGVTDLDERIKLLQKCMQVIDTSDMDEELSVEDRYTDELEIFASGQWRLLNLILIRV